MRRITTEDFIEKAIEKRGDKFSYENVVYSSSREHIEIICNKCRTHFMQTPNNHLRGKGCSVCNKGVVFTKEIFIKNATQKYGDLFGYDKVEYINSGTNVEIHCKKHGYFLSAPDSFLAKRTKHGCGKCAGNAISCNQTKSKEKFLEEVTTIHKGLYKYDLSNYKDRRSKIKAFCEIHGWFYIAAKTHISCKGCKECGDIRSGLAKRITKDRFLEKAILAHGNRYEYDLSNFTLVTNEIPIKCKKHGWFLQIGANHTNHKQGCGRCKSSIGENDIRIFLKKNGIIFSEQHKIKECKNKRQLPFDFAILGKKGSLKGLIEFHGYQHFHEVEYFDKNNNGYFIRNRSDQIKSDFCTLNKIPLLIISDIERIAIDIEHFLIKIKRKKVTTEFKELNQLNMFQV